MNTTRQRTFLRLPLLAAILAAFGGNPAALAQSAETALADAGNYTVQVRTTIFYPFMSDNRGTLRGAGFVIDKARGWIVTNAHVASRSAATISVSFRNQAPIAARRVYVDPFLDFSLLAVDRKDLPDDVRDARLDCSEPPHSGAQVVAFGHPNGLAFTGSQGIVSGLTSQFGPEYLQTDAAINAGSSGGPLIRLAGGLVTGINTGRLQKSQGAGFALPMQYVCKIVDLLAAGRDPSPPRLEWRLFQASADAATIKVARPGRAAALGLMAGDVIAAVNGKGDLVNETQVIHAMRGSRQVRLDVLRNGEKVALQGELEASEPVLGRRGIAVSGMVLDDPSPEWMADIAPRGVFVEGVLPGTLAENAEIEASDYIVAIDDTPTPDIATAEHALREAAASTGRARLTLQRTGGDKSNRAPFAWFERMLTLDDLKPVRAEDL